MKKNKQIKKVIIFVIIFSLLATLSPNLRAARASSISHAKDLLSDSDRFVSPVRHTITFTTSTTTPAGGGYFDVVLDAQFGDFVVGDITCPANTTAVKGVAREAKCTATTDRVAGSYTIIINNVSNPVAAGSPWVYLKNFDTVGQLQEYVDLRVAIIDNVDVHAKVASTLAFTIGAVATTTLINGVPTTRGSGTTTLEFETLTAGASSTMGQQLWVQTNAQSGYSVTVEQDHELLSNSGADINSFDNSPDGTGSTTPHAWANPTGILDQYHTYGHMGLTSDDASLSALDFTGGKYAGLSSTSPMEVMYHTGPADGSTQNKGYAKVAYSIMITSLQEAGDYNNTLTYICTPQF
jgi:hypothetical protein